jgi:FixJ family two-component response regulator
LSLRGGRPFPNPLCFGSGPVILLIHLAYSTLPPVLADYHFGSNFLDHGPIAMRLSIALPFAHDDRAHFTPSSSSGRRRVSSECVARPDGSGGHLRAVLQFRGAVSAFWSQTQGWMPYRRHQMPGMTGIELQAHLKSERCRIPIIFITGRGDIPSAVIAMKEGASDFFTKPVDGTVLLNSVERALQRDCANRQKATERAGLIARYKSLTPREREVLPLLASGLLNKQVAFELGITEYTVQLHRGHIMRKMEADSFAALVRMADKVCLHTPDRQESQQQAVLTGFRPRLNVGSDGTG